MGDLRDFSEFADPPLRLPVSGKVYELPEVGILDGLKVSGVLTGENKDFEGRPGEELWRLLLGPVWDEMISDGCGYKAAARVGFVALVDFEIGREAAIAAWEGESSPEAPAAQEAADRGPETPPTTQPDEASTTLQPDSGLGMNPTPEPSLPVVVDLSTAG